MTDQRSLPEALREFCEDRRRPLVLLVGILILLLLPNLAGCSPYWVRTSEPVPVFAVIEIDTVVCGDTALGLLGCADMRTGIIYVKRGHPHRDCIEAHERKHLAGWSHRPGRPLALDCGDGRIIP